MAGEDLILVSVLYSASIFLGWAVTKCIFTKPDVVNTSDCGSDEIGSRKFETRSARKKRCRLTTIQETTKMPYKYSKIYNASQGKWARDVSGEANATKVWLNNEWEDGDAIIGFYSDEDCDNYEVIYCDDGYAVYVLGEADKEKANFHFGPIAHRVPPVVLVNLNNAYDAVFLRKKSDPTWVDKDDSESDYESDAMSECDDSDEEEAKNPNDVWRVCVPANQPIVDFLIRCCRGTTNTFKRRAYARAIIKIVTYWRGNLMEVSEYDLPRMLPGLSENMIRKIREFIDGVPEEDIINS